MLASLGRGGHVVPSIPIVSCWVECDWYNDRGLGRACLLSSEFAACVVASVAGASPPAMPTDLPTGFGRPR